MPGAWTKQSIQPNQVRYLNAGNGDSIVGGSILSVPSGVVATQGLQNRPGDRMLIAEEDALALSDVTNVGTLYGGLYQYVTTYASSTAAFTRGKAAFWDTTVGGSIFRVTADESGSQGVAMFAGVMINTVTRGYSWWIQAAGKVLVRMKAVFTGVPSDGCPVYLGAVGAGEPGVFDCLDGGGNASFTQVGQMISRFAGIAEGLPVAGGVAVPINIPLWRMYRW